MICPLSSADKTKRALFQQPGAAMNKQPGKEPTEMAQRRCLRTLPPRYPRLIGEGALLVHH